MGEQKYQAALGKARRHLRFTIEMCRDQIVHGGYFLFEHPATASSWKESEMLSLLKQPGVVSVVANMCRFGMESTFEDGSPGPVAKPTRFATNSACLRESLNRQCERNHQHAHLLGGRAAAAQVYPPALCEAIIRGYARQVREDNAWQTQTDLQLLEIDESDAGDHFSPADSDSDTSSRDCDLLAQSDISACDESDDGFEAEDDVHGGKLDAGLVRGARDVEMKYVKDRGIYEYSTIGECAARTGGKPIGTRWVDTNKGDQVNPNYRSRLVAMEFRRKNVATIFAATPPLECLRLLMAILASRQPDQLAKGEEAYKLGLFDVSRAHFYADAARPVYIQLPPEDPRACEKGVCGRLKKSMYGCRDAAALWEAHYTKVLIKAGFTKGQASPVCFHHAEKGIWIVVHGDDFITVSDSKGMGHVEKILKEAYAIKSSVIGSGANDQKELKPLGRIIGMHSWGVSYEPDPGHAEIVIDKLGLRGSKEVATPHTKPADTSDEARADLQRRREERPSTNQRLSDRIQESPQLDAAGVKRFQSLAARLNYYSLDRAYLLYPVKELMRRMSDPRVEDEIALKRIARYLIGKPREVSRYTWKPLSKELVVFVDSDFAGCRRTRKSTSGGVALWCGQVVKAWSKTQATIALSIGEAELAAAVRGSTEALGIQSILHEWGFTTTICVKSDATAAIGIVSRQGLGRVRHLAVADLWVQQKALQGILRFAKYPGKLNPSDMMTKGVDRETLDRHMSTLDFVSTAGRSSLAPLRVTTDAS